MKQALVDVDGEKDVHHGEGSCDSTTQHTQESHELLSSRKYALIQPEAHNDDQQPKAIMKEEVRCLISFDVYADCTVRGRCERHTISNFDGHL